jgi:homoserine O-succinyltransferase
VRLVAAGGEVANVRVRLFTVAAENRGDEARDHIERHYSTFDDVRLEGLDALVVTGANPAKHLLPEESFWPGLETVLDWASDGTRSVLCSCLATHAVFELYKGRTRRRLPEKRWGVYQHRIVAGHPLLEGIDEPVSAPHSHWYDLSREEMESAGATVLMESAEAGVHMAVSDDDFYLFFQGHPEYDPISLLKEYRRELGRYFRRERDDYPPLPEHYFDGAATARLGDYRPVLEEARRTGVLPPRLDEQVLLPRHLNWSDAGSTIYRNWLSRLASIDTTVA